VVGEFIGGGPVAGQYEYLAAHPIEPPTRARGFTYGGAEHLPLGSVFGARSGDKGGAGNVGVWAPAPDEAIAVAASRGQAPADGIPDEALADLRYFWLEGHITAESIHELLPETAQLRVDVHKFPNLRAVNVVIHGLLGRGVADSTRVDPQAKGLGEHLRARYADVPTSLRPGVRS
jgi:hypothetical protein